MFHTTEMLFTMHNDVTSSETDARLRTVHDELRRSTALLLRGHDADGPVQAKRIVRETYDRLVGSNSCMTQQDRAEFFTNAAIAMRHILVDRARDSLRNLGDCDSKRSDLLDRIADPDGESVTDVLELDMALAKLQNADPTASQLVLLRFFAGLSLAECALVLQISTQKTNLLWSYSRAWLMVEFMKDGKSRRETASTFFRHVVESSLN